VYRKEKWERYIKKNWKNVYKGAKERKINGICIYKGKIGKLNTKEKLETYIQRKNGKGICKGKIGKLYTKE
jgi:hypothetical protein